EAVDAGLEQDAGHDRRDMARRGGVRAGQPHVQRHDAGFEAEADHRQQEHGGRQEQRRRRGELERAGRVLEQREQREQAQRADVGTAKSWMTNMADSASTRTASAPPGIAQARAMPSPGRASAYAAPPMPAAAPSASSATAMRSAAREPRGRNRPGTPLAAASA